MATKPWNKTEVSALIESYRLLPILWDKSKHGFNDRDEKRKAMNKLADEFQTSTYEVARKISNLRTQLIQEHKKLLKRRSNGFTDVSTSWEHFDALKFILPSHVPIARRKVSHNRNRNRASSRKIKAIKPDVTDNDFEDTISRDSTLVPARESTVVFTEYPEQFATVQKLNTTNESFTVPEIPYLEESANGYQQKGDEYNIFGEYVASELRNMNSQEMRNRLKRAIQMSIIQFTDMDDCQKNLVKSTNEMGYQHRTIIRQPDLKEATYISDTAKSCHGNNI